MAAIMRVVTFRGPPNFIVLYSSDDVTMLGLLSYQSSASLLRSCPVSCFFCWVSSRGCCRSFSGNFCFSVEHHSHESVRFSVLQFSDVPLVALQTLEVERCGPSSFSPSELLIVFAVQLLARLPGRFVLIARFEEVLIRALIMLIFSSAFYARYGRCVQPLCIIILI